MAFRVVRFLSEPTPRYTVCRSSDLTTAEIDTSNLKEWLVENRPVAVVDHGGHEDMNYLLNKYIKVEKVVRSFQSFTGITTATERAVNKTDTLGTQRGKSMEVDADMGSKKSVLVLATDGHAKPGCSSMSQEDLLLESEDDDVDTDEEATPCDVGRTQSDPDNPWLLKEGPRRLKIVRKRWTQKERKAALKHFGGCLKNRTLPSAREADWASQNIPALRGRSGIKIKAWVNNEVQKRKKLVN